MMILVTKKSPFLQVLERYSAVKSFDGPYFIIFLALAHFLFFLRALLFLVGLASLSYRTRQISLGESPGNAPSIIQLSKRIGLFLRAIVQNSNIGVAIGSKTIH